MSEPSTWLTAAAITLIVLNLSLDFACNNAINSLIGNHAIKAIKTFKYYG